MEGKGCVKAFASNKPISVCAYAYHGYPKNYVDFVPWYQTRTIDFSGWVMVVMSYHVILLHVFYSHLTYLGVVDTHGILRDGISMVVANPFYGALVQV